MRVLHTSDWHLGQSFFSKTRKAEHQAFFNWLLEQVETHHVDAILVSGDIFDTGTPPSYARELYHNFIVELSQVNCQLLILGGNHDSVAMLNETRDVLACLNTQVIAGVSEDLSAQLITLQQRNGEPGAIVCAVPFIRPREVLRSQTGSDSVAKQQALSTAIAAHYQQLYQLALAEQQRQSLPLPIIATGHLSTVGAKLTDSVRDIYIGTLEVFPAQAFPPADYIALGHIHRPQTVAQSPHIRYSGSPLPLSFDELATDKQVLMVDFAAGCLQTVTPLSVPRFQAMQVIRGNLAEIDKALHDIADEPTWLSIEVSTEDYLTDLQQRIQSLCAGLPVEVLQLRRARNASRTGIRPLAQETLAELSAEEIFERRLAQEDFSDEAAIQRRERLRVLYREITDEIVQYNRVGSEV